MQENMGVVEHRLGVQTDPHLLTPAFFHLTCSHLPSSTAPAHTCPPPQSLKRWFQESVGGLAPGGAPILTGPALTGPHLPSLAHTCPHWPSPAHTVYPLCRQSVVTVSLVLSVFSGCVSPLPSAARWTRISQLITKSDAEFFLFELYSKSCIIWHLVRSKFKTLSFVP